TTVAVGRIQLAAHAPIDLGRYERSPRFWERLEHRTPLALRVTANGLDLEHLPLGTLGIRAPLRAGQVDVDAEASGTLHELGALDGNLHGTITARGTLAQPTARADIRVDQLRLGATELQALVLDARYDGARAVARLDGTERQGGVLKLDARVPIANHAEPLAV